MHSLSARGAHPNAMRSSGSRVRARRSRRMLFQLPTASRLQSGHRGGRRRGFMEEVRRRRRSVHAGHDHLLSRCACVHPGDLPGGVMNSSFWLVLSVGAGGCAPAEGVNYVGEATIVRAAVTRSSDGASLYDGCWVKGIGDQPAPPVKFQAAPGDIVTEKVQNISVKKVSTMDKPSLHS